MNTTIDRGMKPEGLKRLLIMVQVDVVIQALETILPVRCQEHTVTPQPSRRKDLR